MASMAYNHLYQGERFDSSAHSLIRDFEAYCKPNTDITVTVKQKHLGWKNIMLSVLNVEGALGVEGDLQPHREVIHLCSRDYKIADSLCILELGMASQKGNECKTNSGLDKKIAWAGGNMK